MANPFMTEVDLPLHQQGTVSHGRPILTIGSCFADEIGARLRDDLFDVTVNPFGALYNPRSILQAFRLMAEAPEVRPESLIHSQGLWHSFDFHSSFSAPDRERLAATLSVHMAALKEQLPSFDTIIVTLGSARAFRHIPTGNVVANCHKLPAAEFMQCDITADETTRCLTQIRAIVKEHNPGARMIVTVSPVRHKAYGLHTDRLSKARLLLGADDFCRTFPDDTLYFPAYEILQDELRDYRFYADDMTHPSTSAVNHIYSCFSRTFFDAPTTALASRSHKIVQRLRHRPLNAATADATRADALEAARQLAAQYPAISTAIQKIVSTTS